jgi:16S rRNA processing protein RimM
VLLEVGHVVRAHGLSGEVVVRLVSNLTGRMAAGSVLECRGSQLVVERARELPAKGETWGSYWLASFAGVLDRTSAEELAGAELYAEAVPGGEGLWAHELVGSEVSSPSGEAYGTVVAVQANPASDLLVLDSGALVPLRFVVASVPTSGQGPGRVTVEVPEGLFEL